MQASTLQAALNQFDPEHSLTSEEDLRDYYISRPASPSQRLRLELEGSTSPQRILFSGHRGTGKSSELAKLEQELGDQWFVVRYSIKTVANLVDVTYLDVILSLALQLIEEARKRHVKVPKDLSQSISGLVEAIAGGGDQESGTGVEFGGELGLPGVGKLFGKLSTEDATRRRIRPNVEERLAQVVENIDFLAEHIRTDRSRRVLIIVEDLDKVDLAKANELFYKHAQSLSAPHLYLIYTFPIALRSDDNFSHIRGDFRTYFLPNVKTMEKNGRPDPDGIRCLEELVRKRVSPHLISDGALRTLVEASGGIPRGLVGLVRAACLEAMVRKHPQIDAEDAQQAVQSSRRDFQLLLDKRRRELLLRVHASKDIVRDEEHRQMVHNLTILEYQNRDPWYDVNPILVPLIAPSVKSVHKSKKKLTRRG